MSSSTKKVMGRTRRLFYEGPLANTVPTKRMGSYSADSAEEELTTPPEWQNFRRRLGKPPPPPPSPGAACALSEAPRDTAA